MRHICLRTCYKNNFFVIGLRTVQLFDELTHEGCHKGKGNKTVILTVNLREELGVSRKTN